MKWLESTVQDLRFALRGWAKTPGFAVAAVATLALGIGANTAVFSVISGVLLRPLPFADPDRLVQVNEIQPRSASSVETSGPVWPTDFKEFRSHSRLFAGFITYQVSSANLFGMGEPEQLSIVPAERGLFSLLGATPLAGRTIAADDPPNVTVVSRAIFSRAFRRGPGRPGSHAESRRADFDRYRCHAGGVRRFIVAARRGGSWGCLKLCERE